MTLLLLVLQPIRKFLRNHRADLKSQHLSQMGFPEDSATASECFLDAARGCFLFPSLSSQVPYTSTPTVRETRSAVSLLTGLLVICRTRMLDSVSWISTDPANLGGEAAGVLLNAASAHEIVLGSISTTLMENLSATIEIRVMGVNHCDE